MKRYKRLLIIIFVLCTGKITCQVPAQIIPDFKFLRLDSKPFTNKDLPKNKKVFIVFFDPACDHCQRAVKQIDEQYLKFKNAGVYLVSTDSQDKIIFFINTFAPHLKKQKNVVILRDHLNQFVNSFQPLRYPSMFLYDANKRLLDYEDNPESVFRFFKLVSPGK